MCVSVSEHFAKFEITFMNQNASIDAVNRAMFIHQNAQLPPGVCVCRSPAFSKII